MLLLSCLYLRKHSSLIILLFNGFLVIGLDSCNSSVKALSTVKDWGKVSSEVASAGPRRGTY